MANQNIQQYLNFYVKVYCCEADFVNWDLIQGCTFLYVVNRENLVIIFFHCRKVTSAKEVMDYVTYGMTHRHEDKTKIHSHSSRSHLIVQLNIYQTNATQPHVACDVGEQSDSTATKKYNVGMHARSRWVVISSEGVFTLSRNVIPDVSITSLADEHFHTLLWT